jgi:hypothetical protein
LETDEAQISDSYDASDKPFDFVEEEGKTALVCESDPERKKQIIEALHIMEFNTNEADNSRDVLKRMRYHVYDLIVLNEKFDTPLMQNYPSNFHYLKYRFSKHVGDFH